MLCSDYYSETRWRATQECRPGLPRLVQVALSVCSLASLTGRGTCHPRDHRRAQPTWSLPQPPSLLSSLTSSTHYHLKTWIKGLLCAYLGGLHSPQPDGNPYYIFSSIFPVSCQLPADHNTRFCMPQTGILGLRCFT